MRKGREDVMDISREANEIPKRVHIKGTGNMTNFTSGSAYVG